MSALLASESTDTTDRFVQHVSVQEDALPGKAQEPVDVCTEKSHYMVSRWSCFQCQTSQETGPVSEKCGLYFKKDHNKKKNLQNWQNNIYTM